MIASYNHRTTSACAENTIRSMAPRRYPRNYLRVRGEYPTIFIEYEDQAELPPRARRIPLGKIRRQPRPGTTSACAENTSGQFGYLIDTWNYLRVRGEYPHYVVLTPPTWELPPRARRIQILRPPTGHPLGTTSACAENTMATLSMAPPHRNYLRVRGEY